MADAFEHFNPGVRHPCGERLGEVRVLRCWLGPGGMEAPGSLSQDLLSSPAKVIEWSNFGRES